MKCLLCGTQNPSERSQCSFCDTSLVKDIEISKQMTIDAVDASSTRLCWKKMSIIIITCIIIGIPWLFMSDLLSVPKDVRLNRKQFEKVMTDYLQEQKLWRQKKNIITQTAKTKSFLHEKVPVEIFLAYLEEELGFFQKELIDITIFPNSKGLMITKRQRGIWPLSVMLSLEIEINAKDGNLSLNFHRLRRGKREISPELAWTYFGTELGHLRHFEPFTAGTDTLQISEQLLNISWQQTSWMK